MFRRQQQFLFMDWAGPKAGLTEDFINNYNS